MNYLQQKRTIERRIAAMERNGLRSWACTISPAPPAKDRNEIESLYAGLDYYKAAGMEKVVLQNKHMGSYVSIYLSSNIEDTKFFSRGGHIINHLDRSKLLASVSDLHAKFIKDDIESAVCEAELMPWSTLGDGLINREFINYYRLHCDNLCFLENSSISTKLGFIKDSETFKDFVANGSDKSHIKRQYSAVQTLLDGLLPNLSEYQKSLNIYEQQLEKYAYTSDKLWFEPFNLVYTVRNGEKILNTRNDVFCKDSVILDLTDFDKAAKDGYDYLESKRDIEGIMIKPLESRILGVPHALKVRNNDYLQLIYGIKFNQNYQYYLTKRKIERKLKASIEDYRIHCALNVCEDAAERRKLYFAALGQEGYEKTLDNRL